MERCSHGMTITILNVKQPAEERDIPLHPPKDDTVIAQILFQFHSYIEQTVTCQLEMVDLAVPYVQECLQHTLARKTNAVVEKTLPLCTLLERSTL